jgi:hypothetical protein
LIGLDATLASSIAVFNEVFVILYLRVSIALGYSTTHWEVASTPPIKIRFILCGFAHAVETCIEPFGQI